MRPNCLRGYKLFHEGQLALAEMEHHGIRLDLDYLDGAIEESREKVAEDEAALTQSKIYRTIWKKKYGNKAKLGSPTQLAFVMRELGYEPKRNERTGRDVLDKKEISDFDHPFVKRYIALKEEKKALDTYLLGFRRECDSDGFLHPSYNLASGGEDEGGGGAESLRGSCDSPNFQNIPIRNKEIGRRIRPSFIPRRGRRIVERDLSGNEVKAACCYTKDPRLISDFALGKGDPHGDTAMQLFGLKKKKVHKPTTRDAAKNQFVFPQFFGSVYFQCAPPIWKAMEKRDFRVGEKGITIREHLRKQGITELGDCTPGAETRRGTFVHRVKEVEQNFWNKRFKVYTQWKRDWYQKYCERGWFELYTGFVCEGYYRRNQVLNFAIQGNAFHWLLWVIIEITKELKKRRMKSILVGEIHDSLLGDVPDNELQDYLELTDDVFSRRLPEHYKDHIIVPIVTEVDVTPVDGSWHTKEEWKRNNGIWVKA